MSPSPPSRVTRARPGDDPVARMAREVRAGLSERPLPTIPRKYFYDEAGSALFDAITRLPEYYPYRTEEAILRAVVAEVVSLVRPRELVGLGSGLGRKTRLVLFLAGTIGNLHPEQVGGFLSALARRLEPGDGFLVGLDLVKDEQRLHAAYNDAAGVTAAFNRNLLRAVNAGLSGDFVPEDFEHVAFYDRKSSWIEMRLRARRAVRVRLPGADLVLDLGAGDEIRTRLSCKYTRASFEPHLVGTALAIERWFTDPEGLFASVLLRRSA